MGKASRDKGSRGEREVAAILRAHGFDASRSARNGLSTEDITHDIQGYHLEIKRCEVLSLPAWTRQAERDANGKEPVVVYRQSGQPWRASIRFDRLAQLLSLEADGRITKDDLPTPTEG